MFPKTVSSFLRAFAVALGALLALSHTPGFVWADDPIPAPASIDQVKAGSNLSWYGKVSHCTTGNTGPDPTDCVYPSKPISDAPTPQGYSKMCPEQLSEINAFYTERYAEEWTSTQNATLFLKGTCKTGGQCSAEPTKTCSDDSDCSNGDHCEKISCLQDLDCRGAQNTCEAGSEPEHTQDIPFAWILWEDQPGLWAERGQRGSDLNPDSPLAATRDRIQTIHSAQNALYDPDGTLKSAYDRQAAFDSSLVVDPAAANSKAPAETGWIPIDLRILYASHCAWSTTDFALCGHLWDDTSKTCVGPSPSSAAQPAANAVEYANASSAEAPLDLNTGLGHNFHIGQDFVNPSWNCGSGVDPTDRKCGYGYTRYESVWNYSADSGRPSQSGGGLFSRNSICSENPRTGQCSGYCSGSGAEPCFADSFCPQGETCEGLSEKKACVGDGDCDSSAKCFNLYCAGFCDAAPNTPCWEDSDCPASGEDASAASCNLPDPNVACSQDDDCSDVEPKPSGAARQCLPYPDDPHTCEDVMGYCAGAQEKPCVDNSDCAQAGGICTMGYPCGRYGIDNNYFDHLAQSIEGGQQQLSWYGRPVWSFIETSFCYNNILTNNNIVRTRGFDWDATESPQDRETVSPYPEGAGFVQITNRLLIPFEGLQFSEFSAMDDVDDPTAVREVASGLAGIVLHEEGQCVQDSSVRCFSSEDCASPDECVMPASSQEAAPVPPRSWTYVLWAKNFKGAVAYLRPAWWYQPKARFSWDPDSTVLPGTCAQDSSLTCTHLKPCPTGDCDFAPSLGWKPENSLAFNQLGFPPSPDFEVNTLVSFLVEGEPNTVLVWPNFSTVASPDMQFKGSSTDAQRRPYLRQIRLINSGENEGTCIISGDACTQNSTCQAVNGNDRCRGPGAKWLDQESDHGKFDFLDDIEQLAGVGVALDPGFLSEFNFNSARCSTGLTPPFTIGTGDCSIDQPCPAGQVCVETTSIKPAFTGDSLGQCFKNSDTTCSVDSDCKGDGDYCVSPVCNPSTTQTCPPIPLNHVQADIDALLDFAPEPTSIFLQLTAFLTLLTLRRRHR